MKFSFKAVKDAVVNFFKNLFKKPAPVVQEATPTKAATPSTSSEPTTSSVTVEAPKPVESDPILNGYRNSNPQYVDPATEGEAAPAEPQEDSHGQGNVKFVEKTGQNIIVNGATTKMFAIPPG